MAAPAFVIQAILQMMQGAADIGGINQERSNIRRTRRERAEDARARIEALQQEGAAFLAQKSVNFLKNGVRLEGTPLLVLEEDEARIKEEIGAEERAFVAQDRQLRKTHRQLGRARLFTALGSGAAATGSALKATE